MARPKPKSGYKTKRKYSCPYCDEKMIRSELVVHVQEDHESMIPEGYTAARAVYDHINGKNYGTCFICKDKVYEWDDRLWRYKNLCNKPSCREAVHNKAMSNHLNDPEKQKIMLKNRKISGQYKFRDGVKKSYTGSYEKKTLEFMDKVMNIPSEDIETPGPTFEYQYNGETHYWITDIFYIPAMLVIDVKDGGDNPNNRPMKNYREKQIEKEKMIAKQGKFNYLRLTNNDFGQFMSAIADIRYGNVIDDPSKGIYINEGAMPPAHAHQDYIIPCYMQGMNADDTEEFVFGNSAMDKLFKFDKFGQLVSDEEAIIESMTGRANRKKAGNKKFRRIKFTTKPKMGSKLINKAKQAVAKGTARNVNEAVLDELLERPYTGIWDLYYSENTELALSEVRKVDEELRTLTEFTLQEEFIEHKGKHLSLMRDISNQYYLVTTDNNYLIASDSFGSPELIPDDLVELMDNLYERNAKKEDPSDGI